MRKILTLIILLSFIMVLTGCSEGKNVGENQKAGTKSSYPMTLKDSFDREVIIEKEPQRIISIAPSITESIYALGKSEKLVGRTEYCDYPAEVGKVASIGSLMEPNVEKIAELKPDLVIASTHFGKETLKKLEDLGIKVIVLYGEESFQGVYDTLEKTGIAINALDKANEVIASMKKKVQDVTERINGKGTPSVYFVVGYGKYGDFTAGNDTFIGQLIAMAGGKNAADDVKGWKYSLERLIEKNPDIMICSKLNNTSEGIKNTNGYSELKAVKEGKLFEIDSNLVDRQGPRLADGLLEFAKIIHPDAFK